MLTLPMPCSRAAYSRRRVAAKAHAAPAGHQDHIAGGLLRMAEQVRLAGFHGAGQGDKSLAVGVAKAPGQVNSTATSEVVKTRAARVFAMISQAHGQARLTPSRQRKRARHLRRGGPQRVIGQIRPGRQMLARRFHLLLALREWRRKPPPRRHGTAFPHGGAARQWPLPGVIGCR